MWSGHVPCMLNLLANNLRFCEAPYRLHYSSIYAKGILGGGLRVLALWLTRTVFARSLAS